MIDKLKGLKNKNKILYYILLPLLGIGLLVAGIASIMSGFNLNQAKKDIKKTQMGDFDLEAEQKEAERKAKELLNQAKKAGAKADKHEENAENADAEGEWHLDD